MEKHFIHINKLYYQI